MSKNNSKSIIYYVAKIRSATIYIFNLYTFLPLTTFYQHRILSKNSYKQQQLKTQITNVMNEMTLNK